MSNLSLIEKLKSLLTVREKTKSINGQMHELTEQIQVERSQLDKLEKVVKHEQDNFLKARKSVDNCELEVASLRDKESDRKKQLEEEGKSATRRVISQELSQLEATRIELEQELESLWADLEKTKNHLQVVEQESEKRAKEFEDKISELSAQEKDVGAQLPKLTEENEKVLSSLPEEWREKLKTMESRSGQSPIAQVVSGVCGACFYPISNRDMGILSKRQPDVVIECQNCFKLLYMDSEEPGSTED